MTKLTGGCACGRIRYEMSETPILQVQCYCDDCRRASGSAFAEVMLVADDRLTLSGAEPAYHTAKADSGRTMNRGFCGACGSPVLIRRPETPQIAFIQAGSLDDPSAFTPSVAVFTSRAPASAPLPAGVPAFEKGPAAELVKPFLEAHARRRG
ncbi:MAG: GFA family protein [Hyphomicrobiaceae bacterium]|nr:GFA family protein [Hyphomicrobiaceae bacterium]